MPVAKIKPCMSRYELLYGEAANGAGGFSGQSLEGEGVGKRCRQSKFGKNRPSPWEVRIVKGSLEINIGNASGIQAPHFEFFCASNL